MLLRLIVVGVPVGLRVVGLLAGLLLGLDQLDRRVLRFFREELQKVF